MLQAPGEFFYTETILCPVEHGSWCSVPGARLSVASGGLTVNIHIYLYLSWHLGSNCPSLAGMGTFQNYYEDALLKGYSASTIA